MAASRPITLHKDTHEDYLNELMQLVEDSKNLDDAGKAEALKIFTEEKTTELFFKLADTLCDPCRGTAYYDQKIRTVLRSIHDAKDLPVANLKKLQGNILILMRKMGMHSPRYLTEMTDGVVIGEIYNSGKHQPFPDCDARRDPRAWLNVKVNDIVTLSSHYNDTLFARVVSIIPSMLFDTGENLLIEVSPKTQIERCFVGPSPKLSTLKNVEPYLHPITEEFMNPQLEAEHGLISDGLGLRSKVQTFIFLDGYKENLVKEGEIRKLEIQGKRYSIATGALSNFSQCPVISCGSTLSRELIQFDPQNAPRLNNHYLELRKRLNPSMSEEEILRAVLNYTRTKVFPNNKCALIDRVILQFKDQYPVEKFPEKYLLHTGGSSEKHFIPLIPIDYFIEKQIGVCRHFGSAIAYFLDLLTREEAPLLSGAVQHMRDNVPNGAHVWNTFVSASSGTKWHIDAMWNELWNFSNSENHHVLRALYGTAFANQLTRTENSLPIWRQNRIPLPAASASTPLPEAMRPSSSSMQETIEVVIRCFATQKDKLRIRTVNGGKITPIRKNATTYTCHLPIGPEGRVVFRVFKNKKPATTGHTLSQSSTVKEIKPIF